MGRGDVTLFSPLTKCGVPQDPWPFVRFSRRVQISWEGVKRPQGVSGLSAGSPAGSLQTPSHSSHSMVRGGACLVPFPGEGATQSCTEVEEVPGLRKIRRQLRSPRTSRGQALYILTAVCAPT